MAANISSGMRGVTQAMRTVSIGRPAIASRSFTSTALRCEQETSTTPDAESSSAASGSAPAPRANKPRRDAAGKSNRSPRAPQPISPLRFNLSTFPSLLDQPHPVLDSGIHASRAGDSQVPFPSSVSIYNSPRYFSPTPPTAASLAMGGGDAGGGEVDSAAYLSTVTPFTPDQVNNLHRHTIQLRRVVRMTGKGRNARMVALVISGNGKGLVGVGEGKDTNAGKAGRKAFHEAVKNMDYVQRYDSRTIPTVLRGKYGGTTVTLRPRPAGFGLRVPPAIHAIARSCGISDLSASILGSTNPANVVKCTLQLLWGGSAPLGFGDGVGGPARRRDRGRGMRDVKDIELERGRRFREVDSR